ncbi:MAG TPA: phage virion morphogenesis protein [Gammaproteobacteria bacterium]|nr:phage virion morphogenesis protein [Gammaproteobacteria bacterium]
MITGAREFRAKLERIAGAMPAAITAEVNRQDALLEAYIKREKLSGQVLNRRTGRLSRSIHSEPARREGSTILGRVGTNLIYAPVHEFGATIRAKRAKYLRFKVGGQWVMKEQVTIPARPYMRPSLAERAPAIREGLQRAIGKVIRES